MRIRVVMASPEPRLILLDEALAAYARELSPLAVETVPLAHALGRVLAAPCAATVDLPAFTQSSMDGYAIRASETAAAADDMPVVMPVAGAMAAGTAVIAPMLPGTAFRIFTGAPLPAGADTVVRQELVERVADDIVLREPVPAGTAIRYRGEELRRGDTVARAGQRLNAGLLAALARAGVAEVAIHRCPRIAVLVTGDEVLEPGQSLAAGRIHDANGPLVDAWLRERGYPAPLRLYVRDEPKAVAAALTTALATADLVITTGGVSVGDRDYVPSVAGELGVHKVFWKVAQKPGKPLWFGRRGSSSLLGMPGNPAAVLVCLTIHAAAMLSLLEGEVPASPAWRQAPLAAAVAADGERDRLVRMRVDDADGRLVPLPRQESHMLSNLADASVLAWLPRRDQAYAENERVRWVAL
jgi:molybdopterin molybdotransferase